MIKKLALFIVVSCLLAAGCTSKANWLSSSFQQNTTIFQQPPQKVVLLLPLSGPLKDSGEAIRNGFLAAYYYDKQQNNAVPTISILNTANQPITDVYQQAVKQGANAIVGPLTKENVQGLINSGNLPVPTLALNTVTNYQQNATSNLFQFGLSPIDEAQQLATYMWQRGARQVLVIAPQGTWGQSIANAFTEPFQQLGGKITDTLSYPLNSDRLAKPIRHLLEIDQSNAREQQVTHILQERLRYVPERRQDFDSIVMIALPQQARIIEPLLQYYYAGNVPTYSISLLFTQPHSPTNQDINGVTFCVMPWLLPTLTNLSPRLVAIRQSILQLWPQSFDRYSQLYALGVDSYHLLNQLNYLNASPSNSIAGATGTLSLTPSGHISRRLMWVTMQQGQPVLAPTT